MYVHSNTSHDHLDDDSTANDSFCLQVMIKCNQKKEQRVPRPTHLITNLAYRLQPHHCRNLYLRARLDTCADVNVMPANVYQLVFNDPNMKKLVPSKLQVGTYMTDTMKIVGSCTFHLVHPDTKRLLETTLYMVMNDGSVLLSYKTTLLLGLIQPRSKPDYLLPRAIPITSLADHLKKTRTVLHVQKQAASAQKNKQIEATHTPAVIKQGPKLITNKKMILQEYPDVFQGVGKFLGADYHIQIDPSVPPKKQTPCWPVPIHLKEMFQHELNKMLQAGVLVPVHKATPWINSFVLVEAKDKFGNLKLHICLDPTNLNKVITREPYHFRMPDDIAHLLAEICIMTVCDCKKGYWHQKLDEASSYLIADDIMVVGNQQNHRDHDIALTNLLETARRSNICLNYDMLHYKATEVDFFRETYTTDGCKPTQNKISVITEMPPPTCKKQVQSFIGMINYLSKFLARLL